MEVTEAGSLDYRGLQRCGDRRQCLIFKLDPGSGIECHKGLVQGQMEMSEYGPCLREHRVNVKALGGEDGLVVLSENVLILGDP